MDPNNLDVNVRPHEDSGFCLEIRMLYPIPNASSGVAFRQVQGSLLSDDGPWPTEEEAQAAADDLRQWWEDQ